MDRWKRTSNSVIVNDDSTGYANAKQRVASRMKRKEQMDLAFERIDALERKVHGMEMTMAEVISLCRSLAESIKSM
jgi:hypothetical protein